MGCLDKVSPGWDLDAGGTHNLSASKGSGYMNKLATNAVKANTATAATIPAKPSFANLDIRSLGVMASNLTKANIHDENKLPANPAQPAHSPNKVLLERIRAMAGV